MSYSVGREAKQRSIAAVPETCPTMDKLLEQMKNECTIPLREALIEAYVEIIRQEDRIEEMERQQEKLEGQVEDLKDEVAALTKQLDEALRTA